MKCPNCHKDGTCKYVEKRPQPIGKGTKDKFYRKNFNAKCICGFEGEVK